MSFTPRQLRTHVRSRPDDAWSLAEIFFAQCQTKVGNIRYAIAIQKEILGHLVGWFTTDVGELSTVVSLWAYESYDDRERRRAVLKADPRWPNFLVKIQPLIHTQTNRILIPTRFSPLQ